MKNIIKKIIASYRKRRDERFRKRFESYYPDGAKFLSVINEIDTGNHDRPAFMIDAGIASTSFVSARGLNAASVILDHIDSMVYHYTDDDKKLKVGVSSNFENGELVIKFIFGDRKCTRAGRVFWKQGFDGNLSR